VSRFIVGQGRTYIACPDDVPGNIPVLEACAQLRRGRALVSMGLLVDARLERRFGVGDLATNLSSQLERDLRVLGPSWVKADRLELFANGLKVRDERLPAVPGPEKARLRWKLPRPAHDVHWVAVATGPGVALPAWAIPRPYQASSPVWEPRVIGATNPLWVDGDGDGKFTPARAYARRLVEQFGPRPALLEKAAPYDEAIAAQVASLCRAGGADLSSVAFEEAIRAAAPHVQRGFHAYLKSLSDAGIAGIANQR
jgi:hypothetical protein